MGSSHLGLLCGRKDVEVAYVCDPDRKRLEAAAQTVQSRTGQAAKAVEDMRRVYEDPRVEAVFIATPDHWHAPAAIMALDAGKHVYVEKPCSHNIREGRLLVEAVKRSDLPYLDGERVGLLGRSLGGSVTLNVGPANASCTVRGMP